MGKNFKNKRMGKNFKNTRVQKQKNKKIKEYKNERTQK